MPDGERLFHVENESAARTAAESVTTEHAAKGPHGLPAPNVATMEYHGFRGVRSVNGRQLQELSPEQRAEVDAITKMYPLLKYGHVGVSLDGGKTIWGFTPDRESRPDMSDEEFVALISSNVPVPGLVKDDTEIFRLAEKYMHEFGWNTDVITSVQVVDSEQKAALRDQVERMSGNGGKGEGDGHGKNYQFPYDQPRQGSNYAGSECRNCATFMEFLGLPIPESTGILAEYIPALKD